MTRPYRAEGRLVFTLKVPTEDGAWLSYSTRTKHKATAVRMGDMVDALSHAGMRAWDVLAHVHDGSMTLPELYDRWTSSDRDIAKLRHVIAATDLEPNVEVFLSAATCSHDTKAHYRSLIRRYLPEGVPFPADRFTVASVQRFIDELTVSPGTKRKAGAALRAFGNWCVRRGMLGTNPVRDVVLPKPSPARTLYLDAPEAKQLADAQASPYREFSALLAGSGIEVSVALRLMRRDVDVTKREIRAAGTKTHARDRIVRVADWAWPYVLRALAGKKRDALLFQGIPDRWEAGDVHRAAVATLLKKSPVFAGYTMRDHRHTYAVRAMRAGTPPDVIARQLGHANPTLVLTVYGRFQASGDERDRWERAATAMDTERARSRAKKS